MLPGFSTGIFQFQNAPLRLKKLNGTARGMAAPRAIYGNWWAFLGKRFAYIGLSVVLVAQRTSCGYNIGAGPLDYTHNMSRATLRQKRVGETHSAAKPAYNTHRPNLGPHNRAGCSSYKQSKCLRKQGATASKLALVRVFEHRTTMRTPGAAMLQARRTIAD